MRKAAPPEGALAARYARSPRPRLPGLIIGDSIAPQLRMRGRGVRKFSGASEWLVSSSANWGIPRQSVRKKGMMSHYCHPGFADSIIRIGLIPFG
jgi:hypothetical protein